MSQLRTLIGDIIFEHNTRYSRLFDILLLIVILMSVLLVMLESVDSVRFAYGGTLRALEWVFTFIFTLEYIIRIWVSYNRPKYMRSFFGIVDLLAILPSYLSLFFVGFQYGIVIRSLRLLRVFRILKLVQFVDGASVLGRAVIASRARITVFVFTVLTIVTILGSIMFLVEGPENGFDNIPESIYWAIVTITTVGYGDIAPSTPLGEFLAAVVMILGYGLIAVPTALYLLKFPELKKMVRLMSKGAKLKKKYKYVVARIVCAPDTMTTQFFVNTVLTILILGIILTISVNIVILS